MLGAVALGTKVIEKHFTDDNHQQKITFFPWINNMKLMVKRQKFRKSMGDGIKKLKKIEIQL